MGDVPWDFHSIYELLVPFDAVTSKPGKHLSSRFVFSQRKLFKEKIKFIEQKKKNLQGKGD